MRANRPLEVIGTVIDTVAAGPAWWIARFAFCLGVGDTGDTCSVGFNPDQGDGDNDGEGNRCDRNDGVLWITLQDSSTGAWQVADAFNLYRRDLEILNPTDVNMQDPTMVSLAGRACGGVHRSIADDARPVPGQQVFLLATSLEVGVEGSLRTTSTGQERPNTNPCR